MNLSQTTYQINSTIDLLLDKGALQLYDKHLNNKLPQHTLNQNNSTLYNNLGLNQVTPSKRDAISSSAKTTILQAPIDSMAPKHLVVRKDIDGYSTLSHKNTTTGKSTNYQTIIQSQISSTQRHKNIRNIIDAMNFQQQNQTEIPLMIRKSRPMTMQTARNNNNNLLLDSKLYALEQKRAMTCHARKRKAISMTKDKQQKLIKIGQEMPVYLKQQMELTNRLRKYKKERQKQEILLANQNAKIDTFIRIKDKKARQNIEGLKMKLKGQSLDNPGISNVEIEDGVILMNKKPKQQNSHIVQLSFNPYEEQISKKIQPRISGVNTTKNNLFVPKIQNKPKITNQQFTNNGVRQVSSIPFMNLNYGIALSESSIQASASRRRPPEQLSREQFTITNQSQRFKSHNPIINSGRVNVYATIDESANQTAKSSFFQNTITDGKQIDTTLDTRKQMCGSILWRPRQKSGRKTIRISNFEAFNQQIIQVKLAY